MRMQSHFQIPRQPEESLFAPPPIHDERVLPWLEHLHELRALEPPFTVKVRNFTLMSGIGPGGENGHYLYHASWDQPDTNQ